MIRTIAKNTAEETIPNWTEGAALTNWRNTPELTYSKALIANPF